MNAVTLEIERRDNDTSGTAFTRLLQWLDDGSDSRGERYLEMRRRLVAYFDRRNRPAADVLADETFDRVSRTLEESGCIRVTPPARSAMSWRGSFSSKTSGAGIGMSRMTRHGPRRTTEARRERPLPRRAPKPRSPVSAAASTLSRPRHRELIVDYYRDAKRQRIDRRRELAANWASR